MKRRLDPTSVGEYKTHLAPEGKAEREPRALPDGVKVGEARPQDVDEVSGSFEAARVCEGRMFRLDETKIVEAPN